MGQGYLPYIAPLLIVALLGWRMSRSMSGRPINPSYLWIRPALIALLVVPIMLHTIRFDPIALLAMAGALVAGGLAGFYLASHQQLSLDAQKGRIISKTSPLGVILFVPIYAVRIVLRTAMMSGQAPDKLSAHSAQIEFYSNLAFVFLFALVAAQAWEIWHRAKPLMAEKAALAAKPQPGPVPD